MTTSRFLGREQVVRDLVELARGSRLVTLTGPPGIGKSRLGLELAARLAGSDLDRVCLVELATVREQDLVAATVASALSIREEPGRRVPDAVVAHLGAQRVVLLLDNCEHLLEGCRRLVEELLAGCAGVMILTTSREPLGVGAEIVWQVPPLSVPDRSRPAAVDELLESEAVRLFVERARTVVPGFELNSHVAPAVAEICRRLDGIPLAIELAAARADTLTPAEIAARLDGTVGVARAGHHSPGRHETLEAALDWSHDLLDASERAVLRRLSVFVGSYDAHAAGRVCSDLQIDATQVRALLSSLVSKSMVVAHGELTPHTRYRLLETIRVYASDKLEDSGEAAVRRAAHARFYVALAEAVEPELTGPRQTRELDRLDAERDNLRRAFEWLLAHGDSEGALRLAGALVLFWRMRCHFSEGAEMLAAGLAAAAGAPAAIRGTALWGAGFMRLMSGDVDRAIVSLEQSLVCFRALGDARGSARALLILANALQYHDSPRAMALLDESAALARAAGDSWCLCHALGVAGLECAALGRLSQARPLLQECVEVARRAEDEQSMRLGLLGLGLVLVHQGDYRLADGVLAEAVALTGELGEEYGRAIALEYLSDLAIGRGDYSLARTLLDEVNVLHAKAGSPHALAEPLALLSQVRRAEGDHAGARLACEQALAVSAPGRSLFALVVMAELTAAEGELQTARHLYEEAIELDSADGEGSAQALHGLARLARVAGDCDRAAALHEEALALQRTIGTAPGITASLEAIAGLDCDIGRHERAARLLGAAHAQRVTHGYARPPWDSACYDDDVRRVRDELGSAAFADVFAEGEELSIEQALAEVGRPTGRRVRPGSGWRSLTEREQQVALLAADSLTNAEMAERLSVAPATIKRHLAHIYSKLGVTRRSELAREVRIRHAAAASAASRRPAPSRRHGGPY